jgi:hypothetical protein
MLLPLKTEMLREMNWILKLIRQEYIVPFVENLSKIYAFNFRVTVAVTWRDYIFVPNPSMKLPVTMLKTKKWQTDKVKVEFPMITLSVHVTMGTPPHFKQNTRDNPSMAKNKKECPLWLPHYQYLTLF